MEGFSKKFSKLLQKPSLPVGTSERELLKERNEYDEHQVYKTAKSDGKLLYSLLLDRSLLSEKNSLTDDNGRVIVYFTNNEVCDKLKCSHDKATKLFRELERFKLICRHKQGKGKPDLIYVRQIARSEYSAVNNADEQDSGMRKISVTECGKSAGNNTDYSNTDLSNTNLSIRYDEMEDEIKYQIEYDVLSERSYGGVEFLTKS